MSLEKLRITKKKLEEDISIAVTKFLQQNDLDLNDIEFTKHVVKTQDSEDETILMVDVELKVNI